MVNSHRHRTLANTGLREVNLEVQRNGKILITYLISQFWKIDRDTCKSLLLIQQPVRLSHTAILMTETRDRDTLEILLHLRTAKDWLFVDNDHSFDRILGTDFTYTDIRTWMPLENALCSYPGLPSDRCRVHVKYPGLDTLPANPIRPFYYIATLDHYSFLPVRVEYYNQDSDPIRVFNAYPLISVDGIWTPKQMTANLVNSTSCSRMTLLNMVTDISLPDKILDPLVIGASLRSVTTKSLRHQILAKSL